MKIEKEAYIIYISGLTHLLTLVLLLLQLHLLKLHAVFTACATAHGTTLSFHPELSLSLSHPFTYILKGLSPKRSPPYPKPNGFPLFPPNDKSYFSHLCKRHAARPKKTLPQSHWSKGPDPMHCTRVSMSLPYCPPLPSPRVRYLFAISNTTLHLHTGENLCHYTC